MKLMPDEYWMNRCLELAKMGTGNVSPNPMVGCVIVHENKIIGEGYHEKFGEAHAEVNAINSVKDKSLLRESMIFVTLEPCAHFGKTPPCANLVADQNFKKVVIGSTDPNPKVNGQGIKIILDKGIEVVTSVLKEECDELNKRFFTFHTKKRPYIILKWAQSQDGFMDIDRQNGEKGQFAISQQETKAVVHKWRHEEAGILVGRKTIENDDPKLDCRNYTGTNPIRIVLDPEEIITNDFRVINDGEKTIIVNTKTNSEVGNLKRIKVKNFTLDEILSRLHAENMDSILVEGGRKTLDYFLKENIWDEIRVIIGDKTIGKGQEAPTLDSKPFRIQAIGKDNILFYTNKL
ncbi:MAG: diaminohydroxyphosphoribosylaminopyrimidine deaminase [Lentimonas sp.]|jgi:diaminohydroxyphosphoribosylaminopyrimidine deaminase/5-amino-6-(5-phosphoribosylamino)uracil reductase